MQIQRDPNRLHWPPHYNIGDCPLAIRPNLAGQCSSEIRHTPPSRQSSDDTGLRVPFHCCAVLVPVDLYTDSSLYRPCRRSDYCRWCTPARRACNRQTISSTCGPEYRTSRISGTTWLPERRGRRDESVARRTACAGETSPEHTIADYDISGFRQR